MVQLNIDAFVRSQKLVTLVKAGARNILEPLDSRSPIGVEDRLCGNDRKEARWTFCEARNIQWNGHRGFTLLEVLTAMMILTISIVVIFQLFSGGLRSAKLSDGYTRAIFHARAKMEATLLAERLMEGETEGIVEEDYRWRLSIAPMEFEEGSGVLSKSLDTLFKVAVDIIWTDGERERTFTVRTLHMAKGIEIDEEV